MFKINKTMSKIEELYKQFETRTPPLTEKEWWDYSKSDLFEFAKLYAEWYAKKCLEIAAENSKTTFDSAYSIITDKQSITNIQLPDHE